MTLRTPYTTLKLAQLLPAVVLNSVIALGITAFGEHTFSSNWVYSQCIGLSIGTLTVLGIRMLIPDWETQWRRIAIIVPVAAVAGFMLGTAMADALLGTNSMAYWHTQPRKAWGFLALSLCAGAVLTYFAVSRAQLAQERERAEAARRQATEARLKLLESQLEPHMLFNTLSNLRALIAADPAQAQTMLDHLIAYLRATLSGSRSATHTLAQEFDRLRDYLELMAVRMGPRLSFSLDLPGTLREIGVPPMLLQPLVENSIQHGLEPKVEGGNITVRAALHGTTLTLEVEDTGLGFDATAHPPLQPPVPGRGYGLGHVRERLQTLYGAEATINFIAVNAGGTRARVTIPYKL